MKKSKRSLQKFLEDLLKIFFEILYKTLGGMLEIIPRGISYGIHEASLNESMKNCMMESVKKPLEESVK